MFKDIHLCIRSSFKKINFHTKEPIPTESPEKSPLRMVNKK